jgi:hypothetical protein
LLLLETKQVVQPEIQGPSFFTIIIILGIAEQRNSLYIYVYQLALLPFEN